MEQNPIQESIQVNQEQDEDTKKNSNEIAEIQPTILKESIEGNNHQMIEVSKDNNTESKDTITTTRSKTQSNPQLVLKVPFRTKNKYCKKDFDVLSLAGKGAYAKVVKARYLPDGKGTLKGIKVMEIDAMERNNKLYQVYLENEVLMDLSHPNIVNIDGIFEEKRRIHIVLEYCSKGDFSDFLRVNHPLREGTIRFFASEMVNVLGYLQEKKIVHRDLKPENILLDDNCHLKVIDFATAKIIGKVFNKETMTFEDETLIEKSNKIGNDNNYEEEDEFREKRGVTFVGTAEYVSPEVLKDIPAGFGADIWALGCMIYQMYCGKTPFKDKTEFLIFRKIEQHKIVFPKEVPEDARDLIIKLLDKDPNKRLGSGSSEEGLDFEHLKAHPFFKDIDFKNLYKLPVPYKSEFQNLLNEEEVKKEKKEIIKRHIKTVTTLKHGTLEKKSPWFHYNTRKIVLDSTPRLEYSDPERNIVKGSIYLTKSCRAEHIDTSQFELVTPNRTFRFKSPDDDGFVWVKAINDAISKYALD